MLSGGLRTKGIIKQSQGNLPLITVVTVVRNGEKTLEETILSVINQTYSNVEYIIVDGDSTDGTLDVVRKYEDRIDYWMSEPDKGIYDAMNKGIDLASGEWLNFMNSGDWLYNNSVLSELFENRVYPSIDLIAGTSFIRSPWGNFQGKKLTAEKIFKNYYHQSIFSRYILNKKHPFDISYRIASDFNFIYKCFIQYGKIYVTDLIISSIMFSYDSCSIENNVESAKEALRIIISGDNICYRHFFYYLYRYFMSNISRFVEKYFPSFLHFYRKKRDIITTNKR
jgi:glycosyltransferase involved in cell wall biosynthesis